ncbi:MAG: methylated-DNA--[protein]-cysteine S-methyltransferase [Prolixibacteraceae bacterium]|nr:methylated-DNA--[protein]-cysteine S-methyltransferase [Prolixibacteraceae bacterium]
MKVNIYTDYLKTPVGWLKLTSDTDFLLSVKFQNSKGTADLNLPEILEKAKQQLSEYFEGKRQTFQLELQPKGTEFQKKIWNLLQSVPFGKTATYLDIARLSGSEKNTRAAGLANGKNPIAIIIPCHRIIGTNGKLTGYAGGIERKRWLLHHELIFSNNPELLF